MDRRQFLTAGAGTALAAATGLGAESDDPIGSIAKETWRRNRDGGGTTWFHPRSCAIPGEKPTVLMTMQEIAGSDYFGPVHLSLSNDLGRTWTAPEPVAPLGRVPESGHEGLERGVCDVVPEFHAKSGAVLAMGWCVYYRDGRFAGKDQLARYPVYAVRRPDGAWSPAKRLDWPDGQPPSVYGNNCGQRVALEDGDIVMSLTHGSHDTGCAVSGVRCSFDGETLTIREIGPPLTNPKGRGLLEPSVTRFGGRFFLTIRAEDGRGHVSAGEDGVRYPDQRPWTWDDGEPLAMSTTQQHWLTHSEGLFLVYTRKDASNANVVRWRSPLWIARVDPDRLCLLRESERVALPLVGDGVGEPDGVALMGNFHCTNVSPDESWITAGEWMPKRGARGDLVAARIRWRRPNKLAPAAG